MMFRLLFRPMLALIIVWTGLIAGVHALTFNPASLDDVRAVLTRCDRPCLMNIRPGITAYDDAVKLLNLNAWVQNVNATGMNNVSETGTVQWSWSGTQPAWISVFSPGRMEVKRGVVQRVHIETLLNFSDIWLMFDHPETGAMQARRGITSPPLVIHHALYPSFWVRFETPCPPRPTAFWESRSTIVLGEGPSIQVMPYDLPGWFLDPPDCAYP